MSKSRAKTHRKTEETAAGETAGKTGESTEGKTEENSLRVSSAKGADLLGFLKENLLELPLAVPLSTPL